MPTLKKYTSASPKSGYYLLANVGGTHPVTLQVTETAAVIFHAGDYAADDSVPSKLVWAMYDLGLVFTNASLDSASLPDIPVIDVLDDFGIGNRLSPTQRASLIKYLNSYDGPQQEALKKLKRKLEGMESGSGNQPSQNGRSAVELPTNEDEAIAQLYMMSSSVDQYRTAKNKMDPQYLLSSLRRFLSHPWIRIRDTEFTDTWQLQYRLVNNELEKDVRITDCLLDRETEYDYLIKYVDDPDDFELPVIDGSIPEDAMTFSNIFRFEDFKQDLAWILPERASEPWDDSFVEVDTYKGRPVKPIRAVSQEDSDHLDEVEILRISKSGNPVFEHRDQEFILDRGNPGDRYLARNTDQVRWQAISKL